MGFIKSTVEIRREITHRAAEIYPNDLTSARQFINDEMSAFTAFQDFDFSHYPEMRAKALEYAMLVGNDWVDKLACLHLAYEQYSKFATFEDSRLQPKEIEALRQDVRSSMREIDEMIGWADALEQKSQDRVNGKRYLKYAGLISELETVVSHHFVHETNGNFRYPITFYNADGKKITRRSNIKGIAAETAFKGHYHVGANSLMVIEALLEIVERLEVKFGVEMGDNVPSKGV